MKINRAIFGYIILIVSAAFLDVDILSLLAIPIFIIGASILLTFFLSLVDKKNPKRGLSISLIIVGTILLSSIVGYSAIKYFAYLRADTYSKVQEPFPSLVLNVIQIIVINLLASLLLFIGIKKSVILTNKNIYLLWLPSFLLIPIVIMLIKLLQLYKLGI